MLLYLNLSIMLDYLQQTTSRRHFAGAFFLGALRVSYIMVCPHVRGDNLSALSTCSRDNLLAKARGLSPRCSVQADKLWYNYCITTGM